MNESGPRGANFLVSYVCVRACACAFITARPGKAPRTSHPRSPTPPLHPTPPHPPIHPLNEHAAAARRQTPTSWTR